jgi:serine phosphatase RsbU (regulator of sigma subunit)
VTNSESKQPILVYGLKATGGRAALATSVAPLKDEAGNVVGGVETFQDETENLRDLEFAQKIQRNLMPAQLPRTEVIAFDARYYPHDLVGGDFYDVDDLGDGKYALFVADVRGHGVSASLYTTVLKSMKDSLSARASDPSALLAAMNRELTKLVVSESFATAAYSVIDTNSWQAVYASAGQPPALHYQALSKTCLPLDTPGMPLGLDASETYDARAVNLLPGDALFYYTDGLTDIRLENGKLFGEEGLSRVFCEETAVGPDGLLDRIYETASSLNSEVAINDDILMLVARRVA